MLQGPYGSLDRERDGPLIRLPFVSFAVGTVLLPFTGLIACLFISLVYHFEESTYTHCQVSGHMVQQTKESLSRVKPPVSPSLAVQLPPDQHPMKETFLPRFQTTCHPSAPPSAVCQSATSGTPALACIQRHVTW